MKPRPKPVDPRTLVPQGWIHTRDIVKGDTIQYRELVFARPGNYVAGERDIIAVVEYEQYVNKTHYAILKIITCNGYMALPRGAIIRRRLRRIMKFNGCERLAWDDECPANNPYPKFSAPFSPKRHYALREKKMRKKRLLDGKEPDVRVWRRSEAMPS